LALHDAGSLELQRTATGRGHLAQTVDRGAQRVNDATEVTVTDGNGEDLAGPTDHLALFDLVEVTEDDDTDLAGVEVQGDAPRAVLELEQLVGHDGRESGDPGDTVRGFGNSADLFPACSLGLVVRHEALQRVPDLVRTDRKLRHLLILTFVCSKFMWVDPAEPELTRPACGGRRPAG